MMTAKKIKDLPKKEWHEGTSLYELSPEYAINAEGFIMGVQYVIVAYSPRAVDHGKPETTIFAANKDGTLFGDIEDTVDLDPDNHIYIDKLDMDEAEYSQCRIVGKLDHTAALAKLGYTIKE